MYIITWSIKTITCVLKVATYIITSIIVGPIRRDAILMIMYVSTFKTATILYLFRNLLLPVCSQLHIVKQCSKLVYRYKISSCSYNFQCCRCKWWQCSIDLRTLTECCSKICRTTYTSGCTKRYVFIYWSLIKLYRVRFLWLMTMWMWYNVMW
jgi:hypothetical protein